MAHIETITSNVRADSAAASLFGPRMDSEDSLFHESHQRIHSEPIALTATNHFRRDTTLNVSISRFQPALQPRSHPPIGISNARRLLRRATLCKAETDEPIFAFAHEEGIVLSRSTNDATPFDRFDPRHSDSSPKVSTESNHRKSTNDNNHYALSNGKETMGYSVSCYATHAEDARKRRSHALAVRETESLLASINASRHAEGVRPLRFSPLMTSYAQAYANSAELEDGGEDQERGPNLGGRFSPTFTLHGGIGTEDPQNTGTTGATTSTPPTPGTRPTSIPPNRPTSTASTQRTSLLPDPNRPTSTTSPRRTSLLSNPNTDLFPLATVLQRPVARLVSPPGMGALAAAEMWYGGKYRRHLCGVVHVHRTDCPCRLRLAFETLVDPKWVVVGVGFSSQGRWVVELGEGAEDRTESVREERE